MSNKKVKEKNFVHVAEINNEYYFGEGKNSLLKRETDINTLLLQLTVVVNEMSNFYNTLIDSSYGQNIEKLKEIQNERRKNAIRANQKNSGREATLSM